MIRTDRLIKLAEHLETGKLGHEQFRFKHLNMNQGPLGPVHCETGCGTMGCAIGECPIAFPGEWEFKGGVPTLSGEYGPEFADWAFSAQEFFGINHIMMAHLFIPHAQKENYGGGELSPSATKEEVARNIRLFVDKVNAGEITFIS
jgi:hypothetical protein